MFTKTDLKNGDVIVRRNGEVEILNKDLGMFICKGGGYNDLDDITEDLRYCDMLLVNFVNECRETENEEDIVKVYRPIQKSDCSFITCRYSSGKLVYDRADIPQERTLEEIEQELGYKVKIVSRRED